MIETLLQKGDLNKMSFLCAEIQKRMELPFEELWEKTGNLTDREYRTFLAIMYQKPHFFREYVMKNLINQSKLKYEISKNVERFTNR